MEEKEMTNASSENTINLGVYEERRFNFIKDRFSHNSMLDQNLGETLEGSLASAKTFLNSKINIDMPSSDLFDAVERENNKSLKNMMFGNATEDRQSRIVKFSNYMNTYIKNSVFSAVERVNNSSFSFYTNPYVEQLLYETTVLGKRGIDTAIEDSFSCEIGVSANFVGVKDLEGMAKYIKKKDTVSTIRTAVIDAMVYGGAIVTPMFRRVKDDKLIKDKKKGDILTLGDLPDKELYDVIRSGKLNDYELECFVAMDRYCTMPVFWEDVGHDMSAMYMLSSKKIPLRTIFNDDFSKALSPHWYASFCPLTTSRKIKSDGFGMSKFTTAKEAVYNYEHQIKFLNYALSQLSIIVFNTKSGLIEDGGGDLGFGSKFGGDQIEDIRAELAEMSNNMANDRGLFLNDIEVQVLNRTFTGVDSLIKAMAAHASLAFNIRQETLFGTSTSTFGSEGREIRDLPLREKTREQYRVPIEKIIRWCVFGYLLENNFEIEDMDDNPADKRDDKMYTKKKLNADEVIEIINSVEIVYSDNTTSLKESLEKFGVVELSRMVDSRFLPIGVANQIVASIPAIKKFYIMNDRTLDRVNKLESMENADINARVLELDATAAINKAIVEKPNPLAPKKPTIDGDKDASTEPLGDLGIEGHNGIMMPALVSKLSTNKEATQSFVKRKSHE